MKLLRISSFQSWEKLNCIWPGINMLTATLKLHNIHLDKYPQRVVVLVKALLGTNYRILLPADIEREGERERDIVSLKILGIVPVSSTVSLSFGSNNIVNTWSFSDHLMACLPCDSHSQASAVNFEKDNFPVLTKILISVSLVRFRLLAHS